MGHCREAVVAHFQGWKRAFYAHHTRQATADAHALLVSDAGFIPIRLASASAAATGGAAAASGSLRGGGTTQSIAASPNAPEVAELPTQEEVYDEALVNAGSVTFRAVQTADSSGKLLAVPSSPLQRRYNRRKGRDAHLGEATRYCLGFGDDLKKCTCHVRRGDVTVLSRGHQPNADEVTLVSAGWEVDYVDGAYDALLESWSGPKVSLLYIASFLAIAAI